jgi:hypothetical protein
MRFTKVIFFYNDIYPSMSAKKKVITGRQFAVAAAKVGEV